MFNIARIDKKSDEVINLEVADQDWIDSHSSDKDFYFIKYDEEENVPFVPYIGYKYEKEEEWFRYPSPIKEEVPVEVEELFSRDPDLKARYDAEEEGTKEFAMILREIISKIHTKP